MEEEDAFQNRDRSFVMNTVTPIATLTTEQVEETAKPTYPNSRRSKWRQWIKRRRRMVNTLTAIFLRWRPEAFQHILHALYVYMTSPFCVQHDINQDFPRAELPLPILAHGDWETHTWIDAIQRFGQPSADLFASAKYYPWAQTLVLSAMCQTESARELLFADAPKLMSIRQTRCPNRTNLNRFLTVQLPDALDEFARGGYEDHKRFVQNCYTLWTFGHHVDCCRSPPTYVTKPPPPAPPRPMPTPSVVTDGNDDDDGDDDDCNDRDDDMLSDIDESDGDNAGEEEQQQYHENEEEGEEEEDDGDEGR